MRDKHVNSPSSKELIDTQKSSHLFNDVCLIIDKAKRHVAAYVNVEACLMNWHVGKRIKEDVLYNQRAEYGKDIIKSLSAKLTEKYGSGWGTEKLKHCVRSAYIFSEPIGLILCSEGNTEHIQYFMLDDKSDIRVAQYYTELPSKEILADRLQRAIAIAREHQIEDNYKL